MSKYLTIFKNPDISQERLKAQQAASLAAAIKESLQDLIDNKDDLVAIGADLPKLLEVQAKLDEIIAVQENLTKISNVEEELPKLVAINNKLPELLQIQENLTKLTNIEEELPKLVAIADELQELLEVPAKAKEEFEKTQDLANAFGISGLGDRVAEWARSEAFDVVGSNTITEAGVTLPQNIVWPNGVSGSLSNLTVTGGNITSLRYNYDGTTQFVTANIDYSDEFPVRTFTQTGFAI